MIGKAVSTKSIQWHPNLNLVDISINLRKKIFENFNLKACIVVPLFIQMGK